MSSSIAGRTTAAVAPVPGSEVDAGATPGLVLVYSRLHATLPPAIALIDPVMTVGRESDNGLAIQEVAVSRYHARIERRGGECWLLDLGSRNGTLVNGERVDATLLRDHDIVRIGDTILRFASRGVVGYAAYRIDGSTTEVASPVRRGAGESLLVGGYQVDAVLDQIEHLAQTELSAVVTGESGTGKELVAKELHRLSGRRGPFQAINCAALPASLIESELFGYRRGAFTGAASDKIGLVRAAHGGTLLLDEVGEMPVEAQAKLLRVLQEREVLPLGATTAEPVDVRVVCATHRDLDELVAAGQFRGDVLARLRECSIHMPPLRERREDICVLVRHFLAKLGCPGADPSFTFMLALCHYAWPYNVRELDNAVRLAVALARGGELDLPHLPPQIQRCLEGHGRVHLEPQAVRPPDAGRDCRPYGASPSETELRALLTKHRGNIASVGREFGKERMQVHRWLKRYNIDVATYRKE